MPVFSPIDEEGKGVGLDECLGEPEQTCGSVLPGLAREPLGPCLKSGLSHFPLIRQFMANLEGQGVICLLHVFPFTPSRQGAKALGESLKKASGQASLKQPSRLYLR